MLRAQPSRSTSATSLSHSGIGVRGFYGMHALGIAPLIVAGLLFYGWRGLLAIGLVVIAALVGVFCWRNVGTRGRQLRYSHAAWLAALLALMLPAHLADFSPNSAGQTPAVVLLAAGLALVIVMWLLGGLGAGRIHPTVVTFLFIGLLYPGLLTSDTVLLRQHIFVGDVLKVAPNDPASNQNSSWIYRKHSDPGDAEFSPSAGRALTAFTSGRASPERGWLPVQGLLRDAMPPLEDLIIGGHPGPIGAGSRLAVIVGGLLLLYRGLIDIRIPALICVSAFLAFLILPIPTLISSQPHWRWLAMRDPSVGPATAITLADYELMASPILFVAFFLATSPSIRPMTHRARIIYAVLVGLLCAATQLYISVDVGPYIALLAASLLTPWLEWHFRPRMNF